MSGCFFCRVCCCSQIINLIYMFYECLLVAPAAAHTFLPSIMFHADQHTHTHARNACSSITAAETWSPFPSAMTAPPPLIMPKVNNQTNAAHVVEDEATVSWWVVLWTTIHWSSLHSLVRLTIGGVLDMRMRRRCLCG